MNNRSYQSGAIASPPSAPASPSVGYPTNGNPGTGTPATLPGDYWFHQIGEELRAVIAAAGIAPASGTLTQLLAALNAGWDMSHIAAANDSLYEFPGGLLLQVGRVSIAGGASITFAPHFAFPNHTYNVMLQWYRSTAPGSVYGNPFGGYVAAHNSITIFNAGSAGAETVEYWLLGD